LPEPFARTVCQNRLPEPFEGLTWWTCRIPIRRNVHEMDENVYSSDRTA
jgi:hypothetical protein